MSPRVHLLLPIHNRRATTLLFVEALGRQTYRNFHFTLIDDGSTDGTAAAVQRLFPEVDVISGTGDWWRADRLAEGCRHLQRGGISDNDVLLLINDDVEIGPDFLAQGVEELAARPGALMLARQLDAATGAVIDHGGGVTADLRELRFTAARSPAEVNCLPTRGLFLRWGDFVRIGPLVPERLPHYLLDYEFTLRARGLALVVAQRASLGVKSEQSGRSFADLFALPRGARFRMLFSERYKDDPLTWSAFVLLAVPPARRPYLWLKIWGAFLRTVWRSCVTPVPPAAPR